jgi:uncharacterized protein (TIGR02145 family)
MLLRNLRLTMLHRLRFAETKVTVAMPINGKKSNVMALSKQKWINKSMLLLVGLFIFTSVVLKAQSPQKINFQSIVRNTSGVIVSNKSLNFRITILSDSPSGTPVYSETHLKTTDAIGLVSLQIGSGTVSNGVFSSLNWGNASHFIKLEADFTGGNTYVTLGTQELMSVPYAMYASKTDTASLNLTNRFAAKAPVNNPTFTGTVGGITKAMVGLSDVDNTSDANKPVSSATKTALDAVSAETKTALNGKAPVNNPTFTGTVGGITKAMVVGLENVENTTDLSKPVSSATQTALATKVNTSDTSSMLSKYLRKADFPSGSSVGEFMYWNGSKWVNLSPGETGQVLTMSSNGTPTWGCLITNSAGTPSPSSSLVENTALTAPIRIATTGATGIDTIASGLPPGVRAEWSANEITIFGTPTAAGTFEYKIRLTGGCGTVNATGTITVNPAPTSACPTTTINYNDDDYKTVGIGTQCWMAENLRTDKYNDGTVIPDETNNTSGWGSLTTGARAVYTDNGVTDYVVTYGYLYNWFAVNDPRKLCPTGWHVPTDSDWNKLVQFVDPLYADTTAFNTQSTTAGDKLKKKDALWTTNTGTDDVLFSALPGGYVSGGGSFRNIRVDAFFWSATEPVNYNAWFRYLNANDGNVMRYLGYSIRNGASVRCLRD